MTKKEVSEIKKRFSKEDCSIKNIAGCYVNANKEIVARYTQNFLNLEEEELYKYLELIKKGISGTIGKNILTKDCPADTQKSLLQVKNTDFKDEAALDAFYQKIIENYNFVENYFIFIINDAYDIIKKGHDGFNNIEDSDEVYDYMMCFICPVKLEECGLVFDPGQQKFVNKNRRWYIKAPMCSFIYPSFEDRSMDQDKITLYAKKPDEQYHDFFNALLGFESEISPEEQKTGFQSVVEMAIKGNSNKMDVVKNIHEIISDKIEEQSGSAVDLSKQEIREILKDSGVAETSLEQFDSFYDETFGHQSLSASSILNTKLLEVKTPDIIIKVKPEKTELVESKMIDGKKCLVINIGSNDDVEVNGISL